MGQTRFREDRNMTRQISIFAENKKGAMHKITSILQEAGINMSSLVANDSAEFGIIRMLVDDTDAALKCLQTAGYLSTERSFRLI